MDASSATKFEPEEAAMIAGNLDNVQLSQRAQRKLRQTHRKPEQVGPRSVMKSKSKQQARLLPPPKSLFAPTVLPPMKQQSWLLNPESSSIRDDNSSPENSQNSPENYQNSPQNFRNSPQNSLGAHSDLTSRRDPDAAVGNGNFATEKYFEEHHQSAGHMRSPDLLNRSIEAKNTFCAENERLIKTEPGSTFHESTAVGPLPVPSGAKRRSSDLPDYMIAAKRLLADIAPPHDISIAGESVAASGSVFPKMKMNDIANSGGGKSPRETGQAGVGDSSYASQLNTAAEPLENTSSLFKDPFYFKAQHGGNNISAHSAATVGTARSFAFPILPGSSKSTNELEHGSLPNTVVEVDSKSDPRVARQRAAPTIITNETVTGDSGKLSSKMQAVHPGSSQSGDSDRSVSQAPERSNIRGTVSQIEGSNEGGAEGPDESISRAALASRLRQKLIRFLEKGRGNEDAGDDDDDLSEPETSLGEPSQACSSDLHTPQLSSELCVAEGQPAPKYGRYEVMSSAGLLPAADQEGLSQLRPAKNRAILSPDHQVVSSQPTLGYSHNDMFLGESAVSGGGAWPQQTAVGANAAISAPKMRASSVFPKGIRKTTPPVQDSGVSPTLAGTTGPPSHGGQSGEPWNEQITPGGGVGMSTLLGAEKSYAAPNRGGPMNRGGAGVFPRMSGSQAAGGGVFPKTAAPTETTSPASSTPQLATFPRGAFPSQAEEQWVAPATFNFKPYSQQPSRGAAFSQRFLPNMAPRRGGGSSIFPKGAKTGPALDDVAPETWDVNFDGGGGFSQRPDSSILSQTPCAYHIPFDAQQESTTMGMGMGMSSVKRAVHNFESPDPWGAPSSKSPRGGGGKKAPRGKRGSNIFPRGGATRSFDRTPTLDPESSNFTPIIPKGSTKPWRGSEMFGGGGFPKAPTKLPVKAPVTDPALSPNMIPLGSASGSSLGGGAGFPKGPSLRTPVKTPASDPMSPNMIPLGSAGTSGAIGGGGGGIFPKMPGAPVRGGGGIFPKGTSAALSPPTRHPPVPSQSPPSFLPAPSQSTGDRGRKAGGGAGVFPKRSPAQHFANTLRDETASSFSSDFTEDPSCNFGDSGAAFEEKPFQSPPFKPPVEFLGSQNSRGGGGIFPKFPSGPAQFRDSGAGSNMVETGSPAPDSFGPSRVGSSAAAHDFATDVDMGGDDFFGNQIGNSHAPWEAPKGYSAVFEVAAPPNSSRIEFPNVQRVAIRRGGGVFPKTKS